MSYHCNCCGGEHQANEICPMPVSTTSGSRNYVLTLTWEPEVIDDIEGILDQIIAIQEGKGLTIAL